MNKENLAFGKQNYLLIGVSFLIIVLGFILMTGSAVTEGEPFNYDIFSTRRIVIVPLVSLAGFILMLYAILKKSKDKSENIEKTK
ncbi:MAG: DUF3098 domain-containing protein [Candidatus Azobacteroides sp.]|nr:DUF3098 domain-containing protein [Candidatus Azobacteroides sp.]